MAYFNHAFNKAFVGTGGFVSTQNTATTALTAGQFTFVDPTTWQTPTGISNSSTLKCPLVLVSKSIYANDKIGKFHGGYQESVKSKIINPKYVSRFYRVDPCAIRQETISIGDTIDTTVVTGCVEDFNFKCGETYYLRLDIKGAPALRYLSRNDYFTASAYTGCCADPNSPIDVNPLVVYINWAYQLLNSPLINPFIRIKIQYTANGATTLDNKWFTSSTADLAQLNDYILGITTIPNAIVAGMLIQGAYVDTQFGDCTFYPNDALQAYLEPVKLYASMVDYNGDPCAFTGVCVKTSCVGRQGQGYGETILRELILSEGYNQSPFYTGRDLRIREITQGDQLLDTNGISRTTQYTRYFIQHSVPRFNNPTGTFDNDQYLLEIITTAPVVLFEQFMYDWLNNVDSACELDPTLNANTGGPRVYACAANSALCTTIGQP